MKIKMNDIVIRTIELEDMTFIQKLWSHKESMNSSGGVYHIPDEMKEQLFLILNQGDAIKNHYVIEHKDNLIGDLSILKYADQKAQIDYKLYQDEKQKGYGKKILDMILDYLFNTINCKLVSIEIWLVESFMFSKLESYGFEATNEMEDATILTLSNERYKEVYNV